MVLGFQTSITATTTSANAAVSTPLSNRPASQLVFLIGFKVSCGSKLYYPDKAMADADTVSIPMADSQASGSGSKQALILLSDKKDLAFLGNGLQELGYTIVSTGGTASSLQNAGVSVTKVEQLTGFPEMLDGRVKTLHASIHGGILAQRDQKHHMEALSKHGIGSTLLLQDGIENIDIGGPAMIRAAAKVILVDQMLRLIFRVAAEANCCRHALQLCFSFTLQLLNEKFAYDFPSSLTVPLYLKCSLRYGENPHQTAAFYADKSLSEVNGGGIATAIQHHGTEMSYNNYLDADAAWNCVCEFNKPPCVIVKHTNPCGVASRDDMIEAYKLSVKADPVSAFGGIVAFNIEVDETLRILEASKNTEGKLSLRQVGGGWLAQDSDDLAPEDIEFNLVSDKTPQENELSDAKFAWLCVKHVKSNAIVIAKENCMLGMGSGQPNRLESLRIALRKAGDEVKGAALASDAFFPFAEPGGSIGDGKHWRRRWGRLL
ncbi:hypothetical protein RHSIM_Rhsim04G0114800 [Rhododendron simsii]|uniref:MGS-like domain-containing protein n=1 Tax=Rhododendron simsii TaxID=118357 RepID=A0A834LN10_RHOSS|nr:hypothetical protein RHSIM_Rhsim04G0114800 [Rhododendron simsii]